jgi:hypothetical protein
LEQTKKSSRYTIVSAILEFDAILTALSTTNKRFEFLYDFLAKHHSGFETHIFNHGKRKDSQVGGRLLSTRPLNMQRVRAVCTAPSWRVSPRFQSALAIWKRLPLF